MFSSICRRRQLLSAFTYLLSICTWLSPIWKRNVVLLTPLRFYAGFSHLLLWSIAWQTTRQRLPLLFFSEMRCAVFITGEKQITVNAPPTPVSHVQSASCVFWTVQFERGAGNDRYRIFEMFALLTMHKLHHCQQKKMPSNLIKHVEVCKSF